MDDKIRHEVIDIADVVDYANRAALAAIASTDDKFERVRIFSKVWSEASKERLRQLREKQ